MIKGCDRGFIQPPEVPVRPTGHRFRSSDPLGVGRASPDPKGTGLASPDPKKGSSAPPDPQGAQSPLDGGAGPAGGPHCLQPPQTQKLKPRVELLIPDENEHAST
jgi:hypothetical protein